MATERVDNSTEAEREIDRLMRRFPAWLHGVVALTPAEGPEERTKASFVTGQPTEYGMQAIMARMRANIRAHGYDPETGKRVRELEHVDTCMFIMGEQVAGLRLSGEEIDCLARYRDLYGQVCVPQVAELLERAKAHHAQRCACE